MEMEAYNRLLNMDKVIDNGFDLDSCLIESSPTEVYFKRKDTIDLDSCITESSPSSPREVYFKRDDFAAKMQQFFILDEIDLGLCEPENKVVWATTNKLDDLINDEVMSEPQRPPDCSSLIALYLQGELTAVPPSFFRGIALLQVLDLSHTSIKTLPECLPQLVNLKKLLLRGCQLFMELSPQVGELENLELLDLNETQIMYLPRDVGRLLSLRYLRVSFYPICGKMKSNSKLNIVIHPETISNLLQLTDLRIDVDPIDKRWDDSVEVVVKELCNSKTLRSLSLHLPRFQLLEYMCSMYPSLSRFRFTVGRIKRRIISRVPQEVEAEFRNWNKCLKFVNGENVPNEMKGVLRYCNSFFLDHHGTAMNLSEFGIANMQGLKFCLLAECNQMETIIDTERHCEGNEDGVSESKASKVGNLLESLEHLSIYYMEKLESIWRGPSDFYICLWKLKFLALHTCPRLRIVFSHSVLENLVNLEEFILADCPLVTCLVSHPSVKPVKPRKFLPKLKRLMLLYLPEVISICNGLLIAPKLEIMGIYNCPKLRISKIELSSKNLKKIKGESQWWDDMRWNETEWGTRPDYLMRIFSPINHEEDVMTQLAEDRDILQLPMQIESLQLDIMADNMNGTDSKQSTPWPTSELHLQNQCSELDRLEDSRNKRPRISALPPAAVAFATVSAGSDNVGSSQSAGGSGLHRRLWVKDRSKEWWEKCNHPHFPDEEFKSTFRMSKATFNMICEELEPAVMKKNTMLRNAIPVRQRVAVCIWRLATGEPLRLVSKRFGMGISTCHKLVLEVCTVMKTVFLPKFIQWPDKNNMKMIKEEFEAATGIPNVGGSIYTTHVPIIPPKVSVAVYFNKRHTERNQKTSYSITLQGVVDHRGVFTDVCIGWPGSMSDDQVLEKSALYQRATRGSLKDVWVVGGTGYPLMDWVLVPYTHQNLSWAQHAFNEKIGDIEKVAKEAFARLKGRWACLQKRTEVKLQDLPVVLAACCVLHNICEMRNEEMDPILKFELFDNEMIPENNLRSAASAKARDNIAHHLIHHHHGLGGSSTSFL